jgi:ferrous iron transport protein A
MFKQGFTLTLSSLELMKPGERGIVTSCKTPDETTLKKLISMGITPGVTITLEQCFPSFVIKTGYTRLALDKQIASAIHVRLTDS